MNESENTHGPAHDGDAGASGRKGRKDNGDGSNDRASSRKSGQNHRSKQAGNGKGRTEMATFAFQGRQVRTTVLDGRTMFVAADVCAVLEHANPRDALSRLDDDEKGVGNADTLGGDQEVNVVTESGLYHLVFTSRKPEAKAFRRWVTEEVLPAIRKGGRYEAPGASAPPEPEAGRTLPWDLPPEGRFIVTRAHGTPDHVQETRFDEVLQAFHAIDVHLLCYAIKTVERHWSRIQTVGSVEVNGPAMTTYPDLNRAILDADRLARGYLAGDKGQVYSTI